MSDEASNSGEVEVEALFARIREEITARHAAPLPGEDGSVRAPAAPALARSEAERFWAVTADRPFLYKPGRWGRVRGLLLAPLKSVLRKLMRWYIEPALAQQRDFNSRMLRALDELSLHAEQLTEQQTAVIEGQAQLIEGQGQAIDQNGRSLTEADERLLRVERRVRHMGQPAETKPRPATEAPAPDAGPDYFAFESRMRGSSKLIRDRQTVYVDEFASSAPVLDLGCGRGEFLALLRDAKVDARGIDLDPDMVAYCRDEGLAVEQAEATTHLAGLDDGLLGGIFCAHVLEHLDPPTLFRLLELAVAKLRPAGLFVAETPNPLSLVALANFSADLSHSKPLHPATLSFLARQAGFRDVSVRFTSEPAEEERLRLVPLPEEPVFSRAQETLDADVSRLNDVIFGPQDYALVART